MMQSINGRELVPLQADEKMGKRHLPMGAGLQDPVVIC